MWTPIKILFPATSLLLLASCANPAGPRNISDSTVPVPQQWQNRQAAVANSEEGGARSPSAPSDPRQAAAADITAWWTRFNDPVLNRLITGALQTSPDIRTAVSKIAEYRARRGVEKSTLLPTLSAGISGRGSRTEDHTVSPHTKTNNEHYTASLDASWEIDLFGKNYQTFKAADADLAQTRQNFHAAQVSLAAEVAAAYIDLRSAEAQLAVIRETLRTRSETTQITRWRAEAGDTGIIDLRQAESTLEQARAAIPQLEKNITQTRNQLALLSGLTPGALDQLLSGNNSQNAETPPDDTRRQTAADYAAFIPKSEIPPLAIPADTLRQRPDIRAAEYAFAAAVARTKSAERERYPTLTLTGSLGLESLKAGHLFDPETLVASALGSLTAPIFTAGKISQNIIIKNEQTKQALIAYESVVLSALSEVENALVSVQRGTDRLSILDRAAAAAAEASELAAIQYKAGQIDLGTLLDTQRTELSLREQQVAAAADCSTAQIQLYKSLGGGWSPEENN